MNELEHHSSLPKKYTQVFNFGRVVSNKDPMNLGRIRVEVVPWQNEDQLNAFQNPVTGGKISESDYWKDVDPLVFMPLLPQFFSQVPKEGEYVHVVFYNLDLQDRNKYYIQGMFSSPDELSFEPYDSAVTFTSRGERNKQKNDIRNRDGKISETSQSGLYPEIDTIGLLGRFNSDLLLPPNAAMLRVNKIGTLTENGKPTFNKKLSTVAIQKFDTRKVQEGERTFVENNVVVQRINYLVEYDITGGAGSLLGRFSGSVRIYKLSEYKPVLSTSIKDGFYDVPEDSKVGLIYQKDFNFDSMNDIVDSINYILSNMNKGTFTIEGNGNPLIDSPPFMFQPTKNMWDISQLNIEASTTEVVNTNRFIQSICVNKQDTVRGVGYVSQTDRFGPLTDSTTYKTKKTEYFSNPITYGINLADRFFILSHDSKIGENKIDFNIAEFSGNTIPQSFIEDYIIPNTSSMVRGEQLMELLELIVRFLISHVHPYHAMSPDSTAEDQTTKQDILTKLFNASDKILNKNLRIN